MNWSDVILDKGFHADVKLLGFTRNGYRPVRSLMRYVSLSRFEVKEGNNLLNRKLQEINENCLLLFTKATKFHLRCEINYINFSDITRPPLNYTPIAVVDQRSSIATWSFKMLMITSKPSPNTMSSHVASAILFVVCTVRIS